MLEFLSSSAYFGIFLSLGAYFIALALQKKTRCPLLNPLIVSVIFVIFILSVFRIDYDAYHQSAKMLSSFLTPVTICLAVPLYNQLELLKKHKKAIFLGVLSGVITSLVCVLSLCLLFGLSHTDYVTLLPKSITTAIGMGVSEELGGHVSITVALIILTGVFGSIIARGVCRLFRITDPVARGIAIGTSSHAIGTTRAIEMGRIEGAMSGLSIVIAGLLTVIGAPIFVLFL